MLSRALLVLFTAFLYTSKAMSYPPGLYQAIQAHQSLTTFSPLNLLPHTSLKPLSVVSNCTQKIGQMTSKFLSDPAVSTLIQYSGRGPNDIGDYLGCRESSDHSYYLGITVYFNSFPVLRLGLCLPNECPYETMLGTREYIASIVSGLINTTVSPKQISMTDVMRVNKELNEVKPGCISFLTFTLMLILCIAFSTFLDMNLCLARLGRFFNKFLSCFSLKNSLRGLLNSENRVDPKLEVLNGIRVFSIGWVVFGHTFFLITGQPVKNLTDLLDDALNTQFMGMVKAGTYAVDVFFCLAGFLATLSFYRAFKNPANRTAKNILLSYFHRYMRLLPMFAFTIIYTIYIQPIMYDSPAVTVTKSLAEACEEQWHWSLLYINNFTVDITTACNGWVWYLFIDMQLFLILPFFVLIFIWSKRWGYGAIGIICGISVIIQIVLGIHYNFDLSFARQSILGEQTNKFYVKPYCRLVTYFMGVLLCYLYVEGKDTSNGPVLSFQSLVTENRIFRYALYLVGFGLMYLMVYSFYYIDAYPNDWGPLFGVTHLVASRPLFVLGVCMIIYPVLVGKGRILLSFLGHPVFNFMGKLTYGTYMLHLPILTIVNFIVIHPKYYTIIDTSLGAVGVFFIAYAASFIVTLLYESPVVLLLKTFLEGRARREIKQS